MANRFKSRWLVRRIAAAAFAVVPAFGGSVPGAAASAPDFRWSAAPHDGEAQRSALGCSNGTNDDDWTCLAVRCEDDGTLGLYYDLSAGGTNEPFAITVEGERFGVTPEPAPAGVPFTYRLVGNVPSIAKALQGAGRPPVSSTSSRC